MRISSPNSPNSPPNFPRLYLVRFLRHFSLNLSEFQYYYKYIFEKKLIYSPIIQFKLQRKIESYHEKRVKKKGYRPNIAGSGEDKEMEKAMAASMGKKYQEEQSSGEDEVGGEEKEEKKQMKAFTGQGVSLGDELFVDYDKFQYTPDDYEIILMIRDSLQEIFKSQPQTGVSIAFRYPNGKKQRRTFDKSTTIHTLYDYVWRNRDPAQHFYLVNSETKEKLLVKDWIKEETEEDDNSIKQKYTIEVDPEIFRKLSRSFKDKTYSEKGSQLVDFSKNHLIIKAKVKQPV